MFLRVTKTAFKSICVMLAIFYSMIQAERYFRNEDTSQISFKQFNKRPQDKYPDLTFCFGNGAQFKDVVKQFQVDQRIFLNVKGHRFRYQFNVKDGIFSNKPLFERTVGITRTIQ